MRSITHVAAVKLGKAAQGTEWGSKFYEKVIKRPDDIAVGMTLASDRAATKEAVDAAIVFSKLRGAESLGPVDHFDQQYLGK